MRGGAVLPKEAGSGLQGASQGLRSFGPKEARPTATPPDSQSAGAANCKEPPVDPLSSAGPSGLHRHGGEAGVETLAKYE